MKTRVRTEEQNIKLRTKIHSDVIREYKSIYGRDFINYNYEIEKEINYRLWSVGLIKSLN